MSGMQVDTPEDRAAAGGLAEPVPDANISSSEAVRNKIYGNGVDVPGVTPQATQMSAFWTTTRNVIDSVAQVPVRVASAAGRMIRNTVVGAADTAGTAVGAGESKVLQPIVDAFKKLMEAMTGPLAILAVIAVIALVVLLIFRPKVSVT